MKNKLLIMLSIMIVLLGVTVPSVAQDEWPDGCQLPDWEETMNAANAAQANGDVVTFISIFNRINGQYNWRLQKCLEDATKSDADLSGADLQYANLSWVNLEEANLQGTYLNGINLQYANLRNADLRGVSFFVWSSSGANLQGADLSDANLLYAVLHGANLEDVILELANLQGAMLSHVNLQGAILRGANLLNTDLTGAIFDEKTILPDAIWDREARTHVSGYWTSETDMARFTDPEHPDFWDPCVELDNLPWYCEDDDGE